MKHVVAHEHWHLADQTNNYSANLPEFSIRFGLTPNSANPDIPVVALDFADPVGKLYDEWSRGTDLGKEFHYPFATMGNVLTDVEAEFPDQPSMMGEAIGKLLRRKYLLRQVPSS